MEEKKYVIINGKLVCFNDLLMHGRRIDSNSIRQRALALGISEYEFRKRFPGYKNISDSEETRSDTFDKVNRAISIKNDHENARERAERQYKEDSERQKNTFRSESNNNNNNINSAQKNIDKPEQKNIDKPEQKNIDKPEQKNAKTTLPPNGPNKNKNKNNNAIDPEIQNLSNTYDKVSAYGEGIKSAKRYVDAFPVQEREKLNLDHMSTKELKDKVDRAIAEKNYHEYFAQPTKMAKAKKKISNILAITGTILGIAGSALSIALAIKKANN